MIGQKSLTPYFKLLQVTIVLGTVEEKASLTFRTLDESIRSEELLHHTCLSNTRPCAVGICRVSIVMEHSWVKAHLRQMRRKCEIYTAVDKHKIGGGEVGWVGGQYWMATFKKINK